MTYRKNYLVHHGILGQKWGKKNGPPYPLGASDHSASEKKAGWRKSLDKKSDSGDSSTRKGLTDKQKKILKNVAIGTGVTVGALLLAYGGYKLYQHNKNTGIRKASDAGAAIIDNVLNKQSSDNTTFDSVLKNVNPRHYDNNCKEVTYAACQRIVGYNEDAVAGARTVKGNLYDFFESKIEGGGYNYVKTIDTDSSRAHELACKQILKKCKDGDCGIISVTFAREYINPSYLAEYDANDGIAHAFLFRVKGDSVVFSDAQPDPPITDLGDKYFKRMRSDKQIEWVKVTKELVNKLESNSN